ncbi:hypothetical protein ACGFX4_05830 [Kitasatospora sp. NPDC048365]|uniref:hypothetical protein n=1 Tax=Kitasatospora sp. NPDC048365 TaxID=3364050 RepID=UPI003713505D
MPVNRRTPAAALGAAAVVLLTVAAPVAGAQDGRSAVTADCAAWQTTEPVLTAHTDAPAARFKVWNAAGKKVLDRTADTAADGTVQVRPTGLAEATGYTWQAWPEYRPGSDKPTGTCTFGIDATAPGLTVASTDFPESGSGGTPQKYAGQLGTFTLTGTDAGSGVACFRYVLNGTLGVGSDCQAGAGPDGTATVQLKPKDWGTSLLTVQAVDRAGNAGQPVTYSFYAPSNPNPPQTPGDVDGDAVPDILLPDAAGNLQVISAAATDTTPTSVVPARVAPGGGGWNGLQVAHRGWDDVHAPVDDLYVHGLGNAHIDVLRNFSLGAFDGTGAMVGGRPSTCGDVVCPADYALTWAQADQLVSLGTLDQYPMPSVATVENGDLWLFTDPGTVFSFWNVKKLSTGGVWAGYDLVAPGKAADGSVALWARERATGTLRAYPLPLGGGVAGDFSALADPASGTVLGTFPVADYPTLGSSGDGDGDGLPDLYAVTADRHLLTYRGTTAPKDLGTLR